MHSQIFFHILILNAVCPEPDEEVEQHITINSEAQVWFSSYVFGQRRDGRCEKAHSQNLRFTEYFSNGYDEVFATDIGNWNMELINTAGKVYKFSGSLCSSFEVGGIDLSDLLRDSLKMPDLYAFDGNNKPDMVNRIEVNYH